MKVYNVIDDQGRFVGLKFDQKKYGQVDTHTYSYLYSRNLFKELGKTLGLEKVIEDDKNYK
jgi:hypothetical protein